MSHDPSIIRDALDATRTAALTVHAALLESTRRDYEREFGRVGDAATLLTLVTSEPTFAWLRPLTAAIADIDACLADRDPAALGRARVLETAVRGLLRADAEGTPFQRRYLEAIQASADVAVTHRQALTAMHARPVGTA